MLVVKKIEQVIFGVAKVSPRVQALSYNGYVIVEASGYLFVYNAANLESCTILDNNGLPFLIVFRNTTVNRSTEFFLGRLIYNLILALFDKNMIIVLFAFDDLNKRVQTVSNSLVK